MNAGRVPFYFYVPETPDAVRGLPCDIQEYWHWVCDVERLIRWDGRFSWTLQTYLQLRACDVDVELVEQLPEDGIIIAHRDFLPDAVKPNDRSMLVVLKPDRRHHPFAQVHVVQSSSDPILAEAQTEYWHNFVMPLWPQPDLVPRCKRRGSMFGRVCYFGRVAHLASDLRSEAWSQYLNDELGIEWEVRNLNRWHDYSDVDAVVAVRGFGEELKKTIGTTDDICMKPFSKLTNCWLAGVPAILGQEPSYQQLRRSKLDFIEVHSVEEVLYALRLLKKNEQLWQAMVENGKVSSKPFSAESLRLLWKEFLLERCVSVYKLWQCAEYRGRFFAHRARKDALQRSGC